ncbi:VOC family protein [Glutamicibacter sp. NPDC087344]|uniref:VOC family protein n=1 Tax=Glutamicibacter sp. NPDC087344 TaxID=3363994 RepID=UPI003819BB9B
MSQVPLPQIKRFDHVGVSVSDLETVTEFFVDLGLEVQGSQEGMEGEFLETVCGIRDARTNIVMLSVPGTEVCIELSSFDRPGSGPGMPLAMANELGLRSLAFEVQDLPLLVSRLQERGYGLIGGIGEYQGVWSMAYIRGPEGLIIALAQRLV